MATRLSSPIFIGRHDERRRLEAALDRAVAGEPGLVLIAGEAGVGKSRLVSELANQARARECHVLAGGCVSLSAEAAPFAPVVEALRALRHDLDPADLEVVLGPGAAGLAPLLPHMAPVAAMPGSTGVSPDTAQGRLLELSLGMLGRLAGRAPVLLIVEDIQWADRSTLDLLAFLARNLRNERVLLVTTFRTDEPSARRQFLPLIAELGRSTSAERIDLAPLNRGEVAEQLSAILGDPAASSLIEAIYARSQGNAFFSEELLAAESIGGSLPNTLRDVLEARIGALSHETAELVRVASAAGRTFSEALLARMTDADPATFRAALREATDHQVLLREQRAGEERLGFRHALVQELLYADLLPSERMRLHGVCARAIEERLSGASDPVLASELAYHWQAADEPERALHASVAAGIAAESAGARSEAALQFKRALALLDKVPSSEAGLRLDRIELLTRAAANLVDDPDRAVEHVTAALTLVDADRDPRRAGLLRADLGRYLWFSGDWEGALAACREAVRLVPAEPPSVARARVAAALGQILMILARAEEGVPFSEEAVRLAAATGAREVHSHALNTLGILTAYLGDVEEGISKLRRALEIADEVGSLDDVDRAHSNLLDVLIFAAARYDEAADLGMEAIGWEDTRAIAPLNSVVGMNHADVALARYLAGRWGEAQAVLDRARLHPAGGAGAIALEVRAAQLEVGRGGFDAAGRRLDRLAGLLEDGEPQWVAPFSAARAELAIWTGDPTTALRSIAEALPQVLQASGARVTRTGPMLALGMRAAADVAEGKKRRAASAAATAARSEGATHLASMRAIRDEIAARWPAHLRLADPFLALCEAEATRLAGRSDPQAWASAAEHFTRLGQPYVRAYALFREGEALLAARHDMPRVRAALREAHVVATRLGAAPLRTVVEEVAGRGRVTLSDAVGDHRRPSAPGGLSAREQEVLELVAAGLTNRQIGERLFITQKTASHHVSNILEKLRVTGRAEAAAEAVRLGIARPPG